MDLQWQLKYDYSLQMLSISDDTYLYWKESNKVIVCLGIQIGKDGISLTLHDMDKALNYSVSQDNCKIDRCSILE